MGEDELKERPMDNNWNYLVGSLTKKRLTKLQKIIGSGGTGRDVIVSCGSEVSRLLSMKEFMNDGS